MTKQIPLTRGYVAIVDDIDFERVSQYKWRVLIFPHTCYAIAHIPDKTRVDGRRAVYLHRFILNLPRGRQPEVDHINHDGLDCRRENMRVCSRSENGRNARRKKNKSGYRGVFSTGRRWYAAIQFEGKKIATKSFADKVAAARAYDGLAVKYHGEFALLNFPPDQPQQLASPAPEMPTDYVQATLPLAGKKAA